MPQPNVIGAGLIDLKHSGLRCRADLLCTARFTSPSNVLVTAAAALRDSHEFDVHTYTHVVSEPAGKYGFHAMRDNQKTRSTR